MNSTYSFGFTYSKLRRDKNFFFELVKVKGIQYFTVLRVFNVFNLLKKKDFLKNLEESIFFKGVFVLVFSTLLIERRLDYLVLEHINLKKEIGSYQGGRHELKLPCRGQGTKRNGKTKKPKKIQKKKV